MRKLRKSGHSLSEIAKITGASKSTVSLSVRNVPLCEKARLRIKNIQIENGKTVGRNLTDEQKRLKSEEAKLAWARRSDESKRRSIDGLKGGQDIGSLAYRQDEQPTKEILERYFTTTFYKQKLAERFFDFVDDKYIIEHTYDGTKGYSEAVDRLSWVINDKRKKLLFCDLSKIGTLRRARATKINVKLYDVFALEYGRLIASESIPTRERARKIMKFLCAWCDTVFMRDAKKQTRPLAFSNQSCSGRYYQEVKRHNRV